MVAMAPMRRNRELLLFAGGRFLLVALGNVGFPIGYAARIDCGDERVRLSTIFRGMRERPRNRSGCKEKGQQKEDHPSHWNRPVASKRPKGKKKIINQPLFFLFRI